MKKIIEKLMYKSFDTFLSAKEEVLFNNELQNSPELREEIKQLRELRNTLEKSADQDFNPFFEDQLLNKLYSKETIPFAFSWINTLTYSFRKIALAAIILLILLVSYNIKNGNIYSVENLFGKSGSSIVYAFDPIQNLFGSNN